MSGPAGKWFNRVMEGTHDRNLQEIREENLRLDKEQDETFRALAPQGVETSPLMFYISQELTRMRQRLDGMRIEQLAQYDVTSIRSQFSDFRVVWEWVRSCGNTSVKFDGGSTRRLTESEGAQREGTSRSFAGILQAMQAGPPTGSPPQPSSPAGLQQTHPANPQIVVALTPPPTAQITEQLERLGALLESGLLTREEFDRLKEKLLT